MLLLFIFVYLMKYVCIILNLYTFITSKSLLYNCNHCALIYYYWNSIKCDKTVKNILLYIWNLYLLKFGSKHYVSNLQIKKKLSPFYLIFLPFSIDMREWPYNPIANPPITCWCIREGKHCGRGLKNQVDKINYSVDSS